jgi:hypothetical protein
MAPEDAKFPQRKMILGRQKLFLKPTLCIVENDQAIDQPLSCD